MMAGVVAAMTLSELLGPAAGVHGPTRVTDLVADSRQVTPGAAFIALPGERCHGLDFAVDALNAGAEIVLYESVDRDRVVPQPALAVTGLRDRLGDLGREFFGRERLPDDLIGVTGTNGKTSVAWLIAQALTTLGEPCGYVGTIGYGVPGSLQSQSLTTPDCLTLHRELAEIATPTSAIEVSSHALAQDRIAGLNFDVAVFTNLSRDHLDWHGTMESYFATKARLFERDGLKTAVINLNDAYGQSLIGRLGSATNVIKVALDSDLPADLSARFDSRGLAGMALQVSGAYGETHFESALIGSFNAENLLLALGVLVARGYDLNTAGEALASADAPPGRMEVFGGAADQPWVIVDFAHTPDALTRILAAISAMKSGDLTCVFGCGGDRDRGKRAPMGQAAASYAQHIVLTDDNPRSEDPAAIIADIRAGLSGHSDVRVQPRRNLAIAEALAAASAGDVVLVAGKGHETRQLIGAESTAFDDRAVVRQLLEGQS